MKLYLLNFIFSADQFSQNHLVYQNMLQRLLLEASKAGIRPPYPLKEFVPKFKLPVLERYDVRAPRNYWCHWPTKSNNAPSGFECGDRVSD